MNWINAFEILCYVITALLLWDIIRKNSRKELRLFLSAVLAGFILELLAVRVTGILAVILTAGTLLLGTVNVRTEGAAGT